MLQSKEHIEVEAPGRDVEEHDVPLYGGDGLCLFDGSLSDVAAHVVYYQVL